VKTEIFVPVEGGLRANAAEWKLLLAAAVRHPGENEVGRIHSLLAESGPDIDWARLLRLVEAHGTSWLLYQSLSGLADVVPAGVLEWLRRQYQENARKSLLLAAELLRVLDCASSIGVELIAYKGLVLAEIYYGDMAARPAGDIDLLVRRCDVGRMKNALRDLGYKVRSPVPENRERSYMASGYEYAFDSAAGNNLLELQWALQPRFYGVDFDMEGLFARAGWADLAERRVRTPSPEDLLLVLLMHAAKHAWGRILWLCDIAQILKRENLDWDAILSRARERGVLRIVKITVLLMNRFLGTAIPSGLETQIRRDQAARKLAEEIAASVVAGVSWEEEKVSYFRLMIRVRERGVDRWRFMLRLTFTPGPGEWDAVKLPQALTPFYRLVRLWRLAGKLGGGLKPS
jgi:hypothetical protein